MFFSEEERQGQGDRLQTVIENLSYGFDETADAVCRQEIIDAVLSMPDTLKEILMMYGYVGYNIHEIADYLNITEDAAYKRLRRARNALAKRIEGKEKMHEPERWISLLIQKKAVLPTKRLRKQSLLCRKILRLHQRILIRQGLKLCMKIMQGRALIMCRTRTLKPWD